MCSKKVSKIYSGLLACTVCILAFFWICFEIYLISDTPENQHDLRMARYLDICFGLLAFFSSLALMYGVFVESKTWITAWTIGSLTVVGGMWAWHFYKKFSSTRHPEVNNFESAGIAFTVIYFIATLPVWLFQRTIEYWDIRSLCPDFVAGYLPIVRRSANGSTQQQDRTSRCLYSVAGSGNAGVSSNYGRAGAGHYLPSYAQCTTNTFLAATHTQVNHLPACKDEDLYNPV